MLDDIETDVVMVDNVSAAQKAVTHLVENGHTEIGIIVGPDGIFTSQERLNGYKKSLSNENIKVNLANIIFSDYTIQGGYEALKKLVKGNDKMTAVFITNYEMTLGAIIAVNELGIKIPEDLSFIGFDNLQLSRIVKPKLTIVDQPLEDIGRSTANLMLKRLQESEPEAKKKIQLMTTLIQRESVARI
jgi:LacI family transcriptional regulator